MREVVQEAEHCRWERFRACALRCASLMRAWISCTGNPSAQKNGDMGSPWSKPPQTACGCHQCRWLARQPDRCSSRQVVRHILGPVVLSCARCVAAGAHGVELQHHQLREFIEQRLKCQLPMLCGAVPMSRMTLAPLMKPHTPARTPTAPVHLVPSRSRTRTTYAHALRVARAAAGAHTARPAASPEWSPRSRIPDAMLHLAAATGRRHAASSRTSAPTHSYPSLSPST